MRVATWSDWHAAVGTPVTVDGGGTWTVRACSDRRTSAGWATWDVTFLAPAGTGQDTVVLDLPAAGAQTVLVVPSGAHADGTLLVATFVVPDDAPTAAPDPTAPSTDGTRGPAADAGTEA